ncbi:MAG TPA: GC-type dockerin domain-anchored protein [Phycisphaerales bacterium]|nr:GC-type dockerin domain-anchored protein [Phycisphaerales bacterium]
MIVLCVRSGGPAIAAMLMAGAMALGAVGRNARADVTVFDNGQFVTGVGTGVNAGAEVSQAESSVISISFNANAATASGGPIRLADDFTVSGAPGGGLHLSSMTFYGVQTSSATTNVQFGAFYVAIYDGRPSAGGALIGGDFTTNRLVSSAWSGAYRLGSSGTPSALRPITRLTVDMSWAPKLANGTYWMVVSAVGDTAITASPNPQSIFVTPHPANANAQQYYNSSWFDIWDLPFNIQAFCPGDFNRSHGLAVQDIFDFLNAWFAGNPDADFNGNGLAVQDIFDFLNAWFAGC